MPTWRAPLDTLLLPHAMWSTFPAGDCTWPAQAARPAARLGLRHGWPDVLILMLAGCMGWN